MDIAIKQPTGRFSLRAACLILRDDRLLLVHNDRLQCWYTVGGRIRQGETSAEAARRECLEETGCLLEPEGPVFVQERFYTADGCQHHEVVFFYRMNGDADMIPPDGDTDQAGEGLRWVPVDQLKEIDLRPPFLKDGLQKKLEGVIHVISRD